jgi:hypothetical protein
MKHWPGIGAIGILHSVHSAKYHELADAVVAEVRAGKLAPETGCQFRGSSPMRFTAD